MKTVDELNVKLFADGAEINTMLELAQKPHIKGLTTNPTLMRKAGVRNYEKFAKEVLEQVQDKPISFEVFSDELDEMIEQANRISDWGKNVNVKIPITNSRGESTARVIEHLSSIGVVLNVTAILSIQQVEVVVNSLDSNSASYVSVFAGRIADTGVDPVPLMQECLRVMASKPKSQLIWASPRELLNILQANEIGCHVITSTTDILNKLELFGKDLTEYSLETVKMFRRDAIQSQFVI